MTDDKKKQKLKLSPIDPKVKVGWVSALRSGRYRQAKGALCRAINGRTGFCCLGVLYDTEFVGDWVEDTRTAKTTVWKVDRSPTSGLLPEKAILSIGLEHHVQNKLARMNDGGDSFIKIANWIEENL